MENYNYSNILFRYKIHFYLFPKKAINLLKKFKNLSLKIKNYKIDRKSTNKVTTISMLQV